MATITMTLDEYNALLMNQGFGGLTEEALASLGGSTPVEVPARQVKRKTKYQAAYKRNFNKIKSKYMKKNGQWKQGGFKRAVKEAHRLTRK